MRIGVLAVQGAFAEHIAAVERSGAEAFEIRQPRDIDGHFDGLILPGGESTVMKKLLHELGLLEPLKKRIESGLPVLGTCAGMILLAKDIDGAYGRQLGSFVCEEKFAGKDIAMRFIRAPYVSEAGERVEVLAVHDGKTVAVRQGNQLAAAFHPELTDDSTVYEMFFGMIAKRLAA